MSAGGLTVAVQYASAAAGLPRPAQFEAWITAAIGSECAGEVGVRIVDEAESQSLNRRYRGSDRPTNVLAFPADPDLLALDPEAPLGDIVICAGVVAREAREQGKDAEAHWAHMSVHGALHLAGFDHIEEVDAAAMEERERSVLAALGYPDPYADDGRPGARAPG